MALFPDLKTMLAALATTEKTDLVLRHIKRPNEPNVTTISMFCMYLKMEQVPNFHNILIHRESPYHVLNGLMIISEAKGSKETGPLKLSVYSR